MEEERNYEKMSVDDLKNEVKKAKEIKAPEASIVLYPSTDAKNSKIVKFNQGPVEDIDCGELRDKFNYISKSTNYGKSLGNLFTQEINLKKSESAETETKACKEDAKAVKSLIELLQHRLKVIFLGSEIPLSGYVFEKGEQWRELYLWKGKADAVGWDTKQKRFIIVEWKVKEAGTTSDHLDQAWVYAKLLKLFFNLDYLPSILIVLIKGADKVEASLFTTYETSNGHEKNYEWSAEKPDLTKEIQPGSAPFREGLEGKVDRKMPLHGLFSESATLEDLQRVFKIPDLEVVFPKHNNA